MKNNNTRILFYIMFILTVIYISWRLIFTLPLNFGYLSLGLGLILIFIEMWDALDFFIHFINILLPNKKKEKVKINKRKIEYPDIDILIATYNEDVSLLEKTINGCLNLKYPDKKKLHIYLCDDGNRQDIRALAQEMNINYITRKNRNDAKAGNYNNALSKIKSPYVVTLDADMIPMDDFLITTIKYFFTNDAVGFVQLPQSFYNPDIFQNRFNVAKLIPFEQQFFYHDLQLSKNFINSAIYCGTNTIFLRKALDDVNGFATDTISEDIATGMLIENKGYLCIALDDVKVSGYSVEDISGFIKQRTRWARGCIQMFKKYKIFSCKGLNVRQKLEYLSCISYWFFGLKRLTYLIIPILFGLFGIVVVDCNIFVFLAFWLPMYILKRFILDILYQYRRSSTWNKIYETILAPVLAVQVLKELIGIKKTTFDVTPKNSNNKVKYSKEKVILIASHSFLLILNLLALIISMQKILVVNMSIHYISLIWLSSNIFYLLIALIFDIGKENKKSDKFGVSAKCKCTLKNNYFNIHTSTLRISDEKISVILEEDIDIDDVFTVNILHNGCKSDFSSIVKSKVKLKDKYKYLFEIIKIDKSNKMSLYQIMYNRKPPKVDYYHRRAILDIFFNWNKKEII